MITKVADLLFNGLDDLKYCVKTFCRRNTVQEKVTPSLDQESNGSLTFWAVIADALFNSIDKHRDGLFLSSTTCKL